MDLRIVHCEFLSSGAPMSHHKSCKFVLNTTLSRMLVIQGLQADAHLSLFGGLIKSLQHTPCHFIRLGVRVRQPLIII